MCPARVGPEHPLHLVCPDAACASGRRFFFLMGSRPRSPANLPCEKSISGSDTNERDLDENRMDFQDTEPITETQTISNDIDLPEYVAPKLPPPLSAEYAALRSDFEIITQAAMECLYTRIAGDIVKSVADTTIAFKKTTDQLHNQITSLGSDVTQLQT